MSNIFEELDKILHSVNEGQSPSTSDSDSGVKKIRPIPISPEMETAEQGKRKAMEMLAKYYYNLSMGGLPGMPPTRNDDLNLPDDWCSPKLKGKISGPMKDKQFDKNKVIWDPEEQIDRLKKEIEMNSAESDDDFDDFDYRDNDFGDDDADTSELDTSEAEGGGGSGSNNSDDERTEQQKLQDAIQDAINKLKGEDSGQQGQDGQQGGSQGGQQGGQEGGQEGGQQSGSQGGQQSGSQGGQQGGQQSGSQGGQQGGQQSGSQGGQQSGQQSGSQGGQQSGQSGQSGQEGGQEGGQSGQGGQEGVSGSPTGERTGGSAHSNGGYGGATGRERRLEELADSLINGDKEGAEKAFDDIKSGEDGSGNLAGQSVDHVDSDDISSDMKKAGVSDKDIKEMQQQAQDTSGTKYTEQEFNELKKQVIDGLEKKCKKKGGSQLGRTIVKHSLKQQITDMEWKKLLKLFLQSAAINSGEHAKANNGIKFGHKNHLWRDAVLPTSAEGKGQIQNIYAFIDFSGSVNQDLVFTFLGKVIDLCQELNYTKVIVYGVGTKLSLPREINSKMLKTQGKEVVLQQTWKYIDQQGVGSGGTDFAPVAEEILQIRRKQRDAVYLAFGDCYWGPEEYKPLYEVCGEKILDRICWLLYYHPDEVKTFAQYVSELQVYGHVKEKNIITTKGSSIRE